MKLATLRNGSRDGQLIVVSRDLQTYTSAHDLAPTLQAALDDWARIEPLLRARAEALAQGQADVHPLDPTALMAPLPRSYEWVDGSAYINHIVLVRKARGAEPPATLLTDPLVYQGGGSTHLGPTEDITLGDEAWGCDFEAEVCVILGDTPEGVKASDAAQYVRLVLLANDVSLRNLIPDELAKGFGFFQGKPATAFSPVAVTLDELGEHWKDGRLHLRMCSWLNGELVGDPEAGPEMHFSFYELIQHITKTRAFGAGTLLGSGTVSNRDRARGISCLAERRMLEILDTGKPSTPFMKYGDRIEIGVHDPEGHDLFGHIQQKVVRR